MDRLGLRITVAAYLLALGVGLGIMVGCSQNASSVSAGDAKDAAKELTYTKDPRTGICYAIVASRTTGEMHQNGWTITYVPCTPEVEKQIGQ